MVPSDGSMFSIANVYPSSHRSIFSSDSMIVLEKKGSGSSANFIVLNVRNIDMRIMHSTLMEAPRFV